MQFYCQSFLDWSKWQATQYTSDHNFPRKVCVTGTVTVSVPTSIQNARLSHSSHSQQAVKTFFVLCCVACLFMFVNSE